MTEYEIIDALISIRADVAQHSMNFITVLFAYIVAAYFVGSKLSRFQVSMITILYVLWTPAPILAAYDGAVAMRDLYFNHREVLSIEMGASPLTAIVPEAVSAAMSLAWLVSIAFMFQVRATNTEI